MIGTRRRPEERRIQHVRLDRLTAHPLNEKLYGYAPPTAELIASIRTHGIIEPLIVTQSGQIISGHNRWRAAKIICAEENKSEKTVYLMTMRPDHLPNDAWYTDHACAQFEDDNPLLLEQMIIEANRQRVKTPEQTAREFTELKRIETELAKQRQVSQLKQGDKTPVREKVPQRDSGKARDIAAAAVGLSGRTAEKLEKVVQAADAGNAAARAELDALNSGQSKSIDGAYKAVVTPKPPKNPEVVAALQAHEKVAKDLQTLLKANGIDADVSRSKTDGKVHVVWHDVTPEQVQEFAERFKA